MDVELRSVYDILNDLEKECEVPKTVWVTLETFIKSACLPEQSYAEDRPCVESDFVTCKEQWASKLSAVKEVIVKLVKLKEGQGSTTTRESMLWLKGVGKNFVVWTLLMCGEHASENLWTNEISRDVAASCVTLLCKLLNCTSVSDLLVGHESSSSNRYFKQSLLALRPKLLKETWRKYPGAVACYQWLLYQVKSPHLSEYLNLVLPTALIIIDDYVMERRLTGLASLSHIIDNVARTELCRQGLQDVVYKAVQPLLFQNDPEQVEPTVACLAKLLGKTEQGYTRSSCPGTWNRLDDTLKILLQKMECEDRLVLRSAYARSIVQILPAMGPSIIRWGKQLLAVLDEYCHSTSYDTRRDALMALRTYLQYASPRISFNREKLVFILLRTLYDITEKLSGRTEDKSNLEEELCLARECMDIVLNNISTEEKLSIKTELCSMNCSEMFNNIVQNL